MRTDEFRRFFDNDNALRVRFDVDHGEILSFSFNWRVGLTTNGQLSFATILHMDMPTVIKCTQEKNPKRLKSQFAITKKV